MEMYLDVWHRIADIARIFLAVNTLLLVVGFKVLPAEIQLLGIFLGIDLCTEFVANWLARGHVNNMPLLHIYTLLEFLALSFFYRKILGADGWLNKYFWIWLSAVSGVLIINSLFIESLFKFNSIAKTLVQCIMIGYAVSYFFRAYGKTDFTKPLPLALALINVAVVLYYSGSLFIFMFSKILNDPIRGISRDAQVGFWLLNSLLFLTFQILILAALCKIIFTQKQSSYS